MFTVASIEAIASHAWVWFVAPVAALGALLFAVLLGRKVLACPEGTEEMVEIAQAVRDGAMAYLRRQYLVVGVVALVLAGQFFGQRTAT